jgi:hypothetical protein
MSTTRHLRRALALAVTTFAVAAPVASARPAVDPQTHNMPMQPSVTVLDTGFDWGSAGIGAAATGGLVLVAAGGFGAAHRARLRLAR